MDIFDSNLFGSFINDWMKGKMMEERDEKDTESLNSNQKNSNMKMQLDSDSGVSGEQEIATRKCPQPVGVFPTQTTLGMAYVPFQEWEMTYDEAVALARGTIFPSLDKPFIGEEAVRGVRKK